MALQSAEQDAPRIRRATADDQEWVLSLAPRLHEFGPPAWRPLEEMNRAVETSLEAALHQQGDAAAVLIAEDAAHERLGFVHMHTARDFFTGEEHGHVSDIVVSAPAEGRGVATALLRASESWSRGRGYRLLTLNVFPANQRAMALYERLGFLPDTLKMLKQLDG